MFCLAGLIRRSGFASYSKQLYSLRMSSDRPALHPALGKVSWLLGKWKGEGCGVYPNISPFSSLMSLLSCILPYSIYHIASAVTYMSLSGLAEIEEGKVEGHKIHLVSHTVGRTSFNKDPKVLKIERFYTLKDPDTLEMECFMETSNTDHQKHLHITYKKTKE
ncbi:PREDICTED: THAP domain-containing protein 4-like [Acropora digitifera]|uniref:THAP domain-containing protein 4-like n=1 Tax=Acropora digitifera TaxID=70779 RepID=UPI00077A30A2|nr:PREDICTED: THAP domain-containing protein 4-like [Acropora digitifera]